ncbi:hypothetical protein OHA25_10775 [Nonomuraea sp. NBC_00507]
MRLRFLLAGGDQHAAEDLVQSARPPPHPDRVFYSLDGEPRDAPDG